MKKLNVENPFFEFMGSIGDVMLVQHCLNISD